MTVLPNGRTERAVLDQELVASAERNRLTHAYLAHERALYPNLSPSCTARHHADEGTIPDAPEKISAAIQKQWPDVCCLPA